VKNSTGKTKVINYLKEQLKDEIRICGKYTDSGDIGMCVQHRVEPLKEMIEFMQTDLEIETCEPEMLSEL